MSPPLWERPWWERLGIAAATAIGGGLAIGLIAASRFQSSAYCISLGLMMGALGLADRLACALGVPAAKPATAPDERRMHWAKRLRAFEWTYVLAVMAWAMLSYTQLK